MFLDRPTGWPEIIISVKNIEYFKIYNNTENTLIILKLVVGLISRKIPTCYNFRIFRYFF